MQHKIDKENWDLKVESIRKYSKAEEQDESRKNNQMGKAELKISDLSNEILELKSKNEQQRVSYQKKIEFVEGEIRKLKSEEERYIKELEIKNKDNEEIIVQLKSRIKDIEKSIDIKKPTPKKVTVKRQPDSQFKVSREKVVEKTRKSVEKSNSISEKLSKSSKSPLTQSPKNKKVKNLLPSKRSSSNIKESSSSKDLKSRKTPSRDNSIDKPSNMPTARIHNKAPSYLRKENQNDKIEIIEKEIAILTGRYKYLLQMSQDASDLLSLRTEISKVATEIEEKSNQLYALKKKQQDFLKQQITN